MQKTISTKIAKKELKKRFDGGGKNIVKNWKSYPSFQLVLNIFPVLLLVFSEVI